MAERKERVVNYHGESIMARPLFINQTDVMPSLLKHPRDPSMLLGDENSRWFITGLNGTYQRKLDRACTEHSHVLCGEVEGFGMTMFD